MAERMRNIGFSQLLFNWSVLTLPGSSIPDILTSDQTLKNHHGIALRRYTNSYLRAIQIHRI